MMRMWCLVYLYLIATTLFVDARRVDIQETDGLDVEASIPGPLEYCDLDQDNTDAYKEAEEKENRGADSQDAVKNVENKVLETIKSELKDNSLDSMAKGLFSLYMCVRWAPTPDFVKMIQGEINAEQLEEKPAYQHFRDLSFMPLRCTKNINVYGNEIENGDTQFKEFEKQMLKQADWFETESTMEMQKRLEALVNVKSFVREPDVKKPEESGSNFGWIKSAVGTVQKGVQNGFGWNSESAGKDLSDEELEKSSLAFDIASSKELESESWQKQLEAWHQTLPFTSFMSPDTSSNNRADSLLGKLGALRDAMPFSSGDRWHHPTGKEQVIVCFGKRVASQLHRRASVEKVTGGHLMTDQSMVGCHGFWDFMEASSMMKRIVSLWKPPTCQLAAMEVDLKVQIMDMIVRMNSQLFDALPAMLGEEASGNFGQEDDEGAALQKANISGQIKGALGSIGSAISSSMGNKYVRLGQLLSGTTVKWVVCPLKDIKDPDKVANLDKVLGTEDDLARHHSKAAYAKWTGKTDLLPGEKCEPYKLPGLAPQNDVHNLERCSLVNMRENMPERYEDQEFLCPTRPMLPAKQQLKILEGKSNKCPLRMDNASMVAAENWNYAGRTPQKKQYNVTENPATKDYRSVKILSNIAAFDKAHYVTHDWFKIGLGCTLEEALLTPRWCTKPEVVNEEPLLLSFLKATADASRAAAAAGDFALQAARLKEKQPSNQAHLERGVEWFGHIAKSASGVVKNVFDSGAHKRYDKMYARDFKDVEANELVHSLSFQSEMTMSSADSSGFKQFDRFAVVAPCVGFDPEGEFKLKNQWSENVMILAHKGFRNKNPQDFPLGLVKMQVRGDAVLHMRDEKGAWTKSSARWRSSTPDGKFSEWKLTNSGKVQQIAGILDGHLLGFEVIFACGSRTEMHDLAFQPETNFRECVKKGKADNDEKKKGLVAENPFFADEVVVRATLEALPSCMQDVRKPPVGGEELPAFQEFESSACQGVQEDAMPVLTAAETEKTYVGMRFGNGLPKATLLEVLVDPADFLEVVWP